MRLVFSGQSLNNCTWHCAEGRKKKAENASGPESKSREMADLEITGMLQ